jgi:hypothetical protein
MADARVRRCGEWRDEAYGATPEMTEPLTVEVFSDYV